jgi:ATP-dependent Clp protease ATP-binding subunit ClpA
MLNFIIAQELVIKWDRLIQIIQLVVPGTVSIIALMVALRRNKKADKKEELDKLDKKIDKVEAALTKKLGDYEEKNHASHIRLSQETERYFGIVQQEMETARKENSDKLSLLIELVRQRNKSE